LAPLLLSTTYEYIRGLLMVILALQIITRPPRHVVFRLFAGGIALISLSWAISNTYSYAMPLFDSLSFVAAALSIGITALERRGEQHTMYDYRIRTAVSAS
jgi:vancomycin permeability regulator SanA